MPGLTPPRGTNAPALGQLAGLAGPGVPPGPALEQDVNSDGVVDEQDVLMLEDFVKMLKSIIKKKSSQILGQAGPQDVLGSQSASQNAELLSPKFEAATPQFLSQ